MSDDEKPPEPELILQKPLGRKSGGLELYEQLKIPHLVGPDGPLIISRGTTLLIRCAPRRRARRARRETTESCVAARPGRRMRAPCGGGGGQLQVHSFARDEPRRACSPDDDNAAPFIAYVREVMQGPQEPLLRVYWCDAARRVGAARGRSGGGQQTLLRAASCGACGVRRPR